MLTAYIHTHTHTHTHIQDTTILHTYINNTCMYADCIHTYTQTHTHTHTRYNHTAYIQTSITELLEGALDLRRLDDGDVGIDVVLDTEVHHLLRALDAADQGPTAHTSVSRRPPCGDGPSSSLPTPLAFS
jgi:hypothetical protein